MDYNVQALFRDHINQFTIYIVEQKFAVGKGHDFFKQYIGKPNYIDSEYMAKNLILKIHQWIDKKIPSVAELIKLCFEGYSTTGILDIVVALTKLFSTQEHQAAGPNVIDPIIIQEGKVLKTYINQLVNLHKDSITRPAIIIVLKDNNFDRAKSLLSGSPDGIYIKFIRNNGNCELYKVINKGAENVQDFITSFSQQCFNTCSNTKHEILLNQEWAGDSKVRNYAPRLLKYRANLLCDEKNDIRLELSQCISALENELNVKNALSDHDTMLIKNFLCIAKLYRVFCNDYGGNDISQALELSSELKNEILKANVYKYAYFFKGKSIAEQNKCLQDAYRIFIKNNMFDNAIYCKNNELIRQFDSGSIKARLFADMIGEATGSVPGLVGMSHLYNNAGLAYMMTAQPDLAMEYFDNGLQYAKNPDRYVQKMAIECNRLILKSYYCDKIEFTEIKKLLIQIFDGMYEEKKLPFISSRYVMNLLIIASKCNSSWAAEIVQSYPVVDLINQGIKDNVIASGQLLMQIDYLNQKLSHLRFKEKCIIPSHVSSVTGKRKDFIKKSGLNPFYFCTWL